MIFIKTKPKYYAMITKSVFTVRIVAILSFLLIASSVFSQKESHIYIGTNGKLTSLSNAIYMQTVNVKSAKVSVVESYILKDSKWDKIGSDRYKKLNDSTFQVKGMGENSKRVNLRTFKKLPDGSFRFKDVAKEQVIMAGYAKSVKPLLLHGQVTEYYWGGKKKSVSQYNNNELVSNENWNEDGTKYIDNIFYSVDAFPFFNPGNTVLNEHIKKGFKDAGVDFSQISGSMKIGFVVMENGSIGGIKIIKGLGPVINSIAVESFSTLLGSWTPAKLNNQNVRYYQVFPINFKSNDNRIDFAEMRGGTIHFQTY
ncbi:MAG TPA: hypothetical protein DCL77_06260 [Prolixibacteraceae bacterium]|jgi:hypothetical protein|nr:hypothetical protein [Prolixibacteraceae bacterium]